MQEANIKLQYCDNTYTCDICSTEFVSCEEYLDHQESHNGNPVFKCDKCEEVRLLTETGSQYKL